MTQTAQAMPAIRKVTILLADEDALRRDGLSAVLGGTENFVVVGCVPDGETALREIRDTAPDIAVVDLNLPKLHGIELIRRVRAEKPGTRIIIMASTADDEIIREVVRAGGDGYLLKNGPARHLIDAISYVQDGGQYFSPQLHRDGRDRHLLEEPPRQYQEPPANLPTAALPGATESDDDEDDLPETGRRAGSNRPVRSGKLHRAADSRQFRERLREDSAAPDLTQRDYEIMSMMADGIRPILDRLDEIDNRVALMEEGDEPVPPNPRGWLTTQLADTLGETRVATTGRGTAGELEARLPELIEEAVTRRFNQMAGKLQQEIEETHVRTLESFVKNIQVKLVQRVSALEQDMSKQAEAMHQLREYSLRTEDNLSRLISGVDKLAQDLPRRLAAAQPETILAEPSIAPRETIIEGIREEPARIPREPGAPAMATPRPLKRRASRNNRRMRGILTLIGVLVVLILIAWGVAHLASSSGGFTPPPSAPIAAAPSAGKKAPLPANADIKTRMDAAQQYTDSKDYAMAESIYRQIVADDPNNVDALKGLATVLYREDKVDESAAILDKISK